MQERCSKIHGVQMTSASRLVVNSVALFPGNEAVNSVTAVPISLLCTKCVYHILLYPIYIQWLEEEFLPYLDRWEHSVKEREGFSVAEQNKMLLSAETRLGLKFTGSSILKK